MPSSARTERSDAPSVEEALHEADELVREASFAAALELLTRVNRLTPSAVVEQRLLSVRHEAALQRRSDAAGSTVPRVDVVPARTLEECEWPPAVDARDVTPAILNAAIRTRGALLVRSLASPEWRQRLIDDIDRAFEACDASDDPERRSDLARFYEPFTPCPFEIQVNRPWLRQGGGLLAGDSPRTFFELFEMFGDVGLVELLAGALGERPLVSLDKSTLRRVTHGGGIEWHQDGAFLGRDARAVNVWLALNGAGREAPGLDVVPRHVDEIVPTGTGGAAYDWSIGPETIDLLCGTSGYARPVFEPGDALLFDGLLVHRTSDAPEMQGVRYAAETWFFAASTYPEQQRVPLAV